jgi:hypothetical protein
LRRASLAGVAAAVLGVSALGVAGLAPAAEDGASSGPPAVVVRDDAGEVLASVPLRRGRFAVSYRNSIYGTLAESRYVAMPRGRFRLTHVAADQRAVIEEYYALPGPRRTGAGDRRTWVIEPARSMTFDDLSIAATDLGERTLHAPGQPPVRMWRLVDDDDPIVTLAIEEHG